MVEQQPSKLNTAVRFRSPAPNRPSCQNVNTPSARSALPYADVTAASIVLPTISHSLVTSTALGRCPCLAPTTIACECDCAAGIAKPHDTAVPGMFTTSAHGPPFCLSACRVIPGPAKCAGTWRKRNGSIIVCESDAPVGQPNDRAEYERQTK